MQTGLENLNQNPRGEKPDIKDTDPSVDGFIVRESSTFKLLLTLNIGGLWRPQYEFVLQALALDEIEVVKALLRDAMEEIQTLKAAAQPKIPVQQNAFLSLSSAAAMAYQQIVAWNGPQGLISVSHFAVSADHCNITVKLRGVYQIHCRLGQCNTCNGQYLSLLINAVEIAQCLQSDGHNYQNTAQITEVAEIAAGATLQVRCGAEGSSIGQHLQTHLSIVLLQAL